MNIIDISNWTIDEINNSIDTFKDTSLTDIGMVNCDIDSINVVGEVATATLWINEDVKIDGYTGTAPLKIYKEDKIELRLNSPLLEGDTIEVIDGKLCHYHRYEKVVLDGSEDWKSPHNFFWVQKKYLPSPLNEREAKKDSVVFVDTMGHGYIDNNTANNNKNSINRLKLAIQDSGNGGTNIRIILKDIKDDDIDGLKQWLSENPTTIIYELETPYYEEITPLQSSIILKTFLESSMIINTNLPIKANVSYRTNVPSISTLSNRVAEVSESDSVIQNLIDIIDDEVDE